VPQLFPPCRLRFNMSGIRSKREKLAGYEAPRGVGGEAFRAGRAGCKQDQNHHRQPSNHTGPSPVTPSHRNLLLDELPQRYRHLPAS
jgi:hypothetical protein